MSDMFTPTSSDPDVQKKYDRITGNSEVMRQIWRTTYDKAMKDTDVKKFMATIPPDLITKEMMIHGGINAVREFIKQKDNPDYEPHLEWYGGNITVTYSKRPEKLARERKAAWKRQRHMGTIQGDNARAQLNEIEMTRGNADAVGRLIEIVQKYHDHEFQRGMWLVGDVGIGKTYMLAAFCNAINEEKGASVMMLTMEELIRESYDKINQGRDGFQKLINQATGVDVLVIDDIGAESLTWWIIDNILTPIMYDRESKKLITCFTSNYTMRDYFSKLVNYRDKDNVKSPKEKEMKAKQLYSRMDRLVQEMQIIGENKRHALSKEGN